MANQTIFISSICNTSVTRRQYYSLHLVTELVTEHSTEALTPTPKNPGRDDENGNGVRCECCPETGGYTVCTFYEFH